MFVERIKRIKQSLSALMISRLRLEQRRKLTGLAFVIPALVFYLGLFIYPGLFTWYLSFSRWELVGDPQFVGLKNFIVMFTGDPIFRDSIRATFYYAFGFVAVTSLFALGAALVFNEDFRGKRILLLLFFTPSIIGLVQWCMAWMVMFHPTFGPFNRALFYSWGYPGTLRWLTDPALAIPAMIILGTLHEMPYFTVILLAGLRGVSKSYYEVALVGGANRLQRFRYVTFPLIRHVMLYVLIIATIGGFQFFIPPYVLTKGGPVNTTRVLPLYIYQSAFTYHKFGYAAALSVLMLIILSVISTIFIRRWR